MNSRATLTADQAAFQQLISWCADRVQESVFCGVPGIEHFPTLKAEDVDLICRLRSIDVGDALIDFPLDDETALLGDLCALGALRSVRIHVACKRAIFGDVQDELSARERNEAIEHDRREWLQSAGMIG